MMEKIKMFFGSLSVLIAMLPAQAENFFNAVG
jgi:hypothetical protein